MTEHCVHLRDHVLRLLVQHLSISHHHAASHLLVQVSEDVVNSLPHMKVILWHPWRRWQRKNCWYHCYSSANVHLIPNLMLSCQCYVSLQEHDISSIPDQGLSHSPMTLASSSVSVLLKYVFFTRSVCPEGKVQPVLGMGGSPSFCCSLSAMTRNALRPIFILCTEKKLEDQLFVINFQGCIINPAETETPPQQKKIYCTRTYYSYRKLPSNSSLL